MRQRRTHYFSPRRESTDTKVALFRGDSTDLANRRNVYHITLRKALSQRGIKIRASGQDLAAR